MSLHSLNGYALTLPDWVKEFRSHQESAITEIVRHLESRPVVFLDAPTGSGKTLIGEVTRQIVRARGWAKQALYLCTTKTLQTQFLNDYPYAALIQGRSNYPTLDETARFASHGLRHLDASMCTLKAYRSSRVCDLCTNSYDDDESDKSYLHCFHCHPWQLCPYRVAKSIALRSELAVANTAYFLTEANHVGTFGVTKPDAPPPFQFVIVDEADTLESVLMSYIELTVPRRLLKELDISQPKITVSQSWREWVVNLINKIQPIVSQLQRQVDSYEEANSNAPTSLLKDLETWSKHLNQCRYVLQRFDTNPDNWVFDAKQGSSVSLRPITVADFAQDLFFKHSTKFLMMSATLISPHQMAIDLGLTPDQWEAVEVTSSFPKERRPIRVRPTVSMSHKTKDDDLPILARAIEEIIKTHHEERILIHTVSYERARYLADYLGGCDLGTRVFTYGSAHQREKVLEEFKRTRAAVLLAPSMDRGIDLPYDACRVVVVAKVPWPNIGDKQVSTRVYGTSSGRSWYAVQTVRSLVQMTGRGMRHADDYCTCVSPETLIMTKELTWKPAGDLMVDDDLLAFDELVPQPTDGRRHLLRRWRPGKVIATGIRLLPRYRITLSTGEVLYSTPEHRWITEEGQYRDHRWVRTDALREGHHLMRYLMPWKPEEGREAGWLAGFFDGEGSLGLSQGQRNRNVTSIVVNQKPGPVWDEAQHLLKEFGFEIAISPQRTSGVELLAIRGGFPEHLRFLGQIRPLRLLAKLISNDFGQAFRACGVARVEHVERVEDGPMVTLHSSTETYIAEGFAAHNTYILDDQFRTNLWRNSRHLIPHWWTEAVVWEPPT